MKKKVSILKKVILMFLVVSVIFSWNISENYSVVSAASKASYKIVNKRQIKKYNKLKAEYSYQLPQLKGKSSAIKKINK